ncbi:hypothetical protein D3C85_1585410 [compost metagenome]
MQREIVQGQRGAPHAARLGPQHAQAAARELLREGVEIQRIALRRGQQHHRLALAVLGRIDHHIDFAAFHGDQFTPAYDFRSGHGLPISPRSRRTA